MPTSEKLAKIYDEWLKRYSENPEEFSTTLLDEEETPIKGYGKKCAAYFEKLNNEIN